MFMTQELRTALINVANRGGQKDVGLGLDLSVIGIVKEDIQNNSEEKILQNSITLKEELRIDYSYIEEAVPETVTTGSAATTATITATATATTTTTTTTTNIKCLPIPHSKARDELERVKNETGDTCLNNTSVFKLTRDGRILRYTRFFSGRPAYGDGRYRARKLRIKKRKALLRPLALLEDQTEAFHKSQPTFSARSGRTSTLQQILSGLASSGRRKISSRFKQIEEVFEQRHPTDETLVPNPEALQISITNDFANFHLVDLVDWEGDIVWDAPPGPPVKSHLTPLYAGVVPTTTGPPSGLASRISSVSASRPITPIPVLAQRQPVSGAPSRSTTPAPIAAPKSIAGRIVNNEFLFGSWEEQIIWDDFKLPENMPPTNLQLNMNDPFLIFDTVDMASLTEKLLKTEKLIQKRLKKLRHGTTSDGKTLVLIKYDRPVADRFNLSNDKHYEAPAKDNPSNGIVGRPGSSSRVMVSSRVGVQHSIPALKLALPFYKTFWTKHELRAWHRPKLDVSVLVNRPFSFEKLVKKKDSAGRKSTTGLINTSKKISLREGASEFTLLEYSEEFPLLMMNVGMATFLLHFYRKLQVKDAPSLEYEYGVPRVLEPNEASPFWFFGDVRPGETIPAIQNNLFRAPLFEHFSGSLDFLVMKFNPKGKTESKWFIRELPYKIFTVGQVFPTLEVFGPHSRKHNIFCRSRIQSFAYRLFRKDVHNTSTAGSENLPRLKINRIMAAFPQFSEGSLRKWLKDYADSIRTGHDSGTWRMRKDAPNLNEDDLRALVTPEMVCQYESMLAGQQRLNDAGFMDSPEVEGEDDSAIDNESAEVRLSPWNLSTNFINATVGKCTLQLHGLGDPSGRGEGFSFVKVPLKTTTTSGGVKSLPASEVPQNEPLSVTITPNSNNQSSQVNVLGSGSTITKTIKVSPEQVAYRQEIVKIWDAQLKALRQSPPADEECLSANQHFSMFEESSPTIRENIDDETASVTSRSSATAGKPSSSSRKLVIKRIFQNSETGTQREETEIVEDPRLVSAYINQRRVWERKRRRREIAAAASAARAKKARPDGFPLKAPKPRAPSISKPRKEVLVKCGTCGQIGHMRTNRICSRYSEYEAEVKKLELEEEQRRQAREQSGIRMDGAKISISKTLLDSATSAPVPPIKFKIPLGGNTSNNQQDSKPIIDSRPVPSPLLQYIPKPRKKKGVDLESLDLEKRQATMELSNQFNKTIELLMAMEDSWPFHRPVSKSEYPHYFRMISRPMDLGTIRSRIKRHYYSQIRDLLSDIKLVRDNCVQFNGLDHPFSSTITRICEVAIQKLADTAVTKAEMALHHGNLSDTQPTIEMDHNDEDDNENDNEDDPEHSELVIDDT